MFGLFKSTFEAVPKAFQDGVLSFVTTKKPGVGKNIKLRLLFSAADSLVDKVVTCTVGSVEAEKDGGFLCQGVLKLSQSESESLLANFTLAGLDGVCRRQTPRYKYAARVLSRRLKNFRAVMSDLNLGGFQILADGPVEPGIFFNVQVDLESVGEGELTVQVLSMWTDSEPDERGTYRTGVSLTKQNRAIHEAWARLYSYVAANEGGSVMQRTMGGAPPAPTPDKLDAQPAPSVPQPAASTPVPQEPPPLPGFQPGPPTGYAPTSPGSFQPAPAAGQPSVPIPGFQPAPPSGFQPNSQNLPGNQQFLPPTTPTFGAPVFQNQKPKALPQQPASAISLNQSNPLEDDSSFSLGFGNQHAAPNRDVRRLQLPELGGQAARSQGAQQQPTAPGFPSAPMRPINPGFTPPPPPSFTQAPKAPLDFSPSPGASTGFTPPPPPPSFSPQAPFGGAPPSPTLPNFGTPNPSPNPLNFGQGSAPNMGITPPPLPGSSP